MLVYQRVREHFSRNQETIDFPMKYWGLNHNTFSPIKPWRCEWRIKVMFTSWESTGFEVSGASLGSSICWLWHLQWQFQDPVDWRYRFHIFLAYFFRPKFQGISPQNMARNLVQYLHFRILEFPLTSLGWRGHVSCTAASAAAKDGGLISQLVFVFLIVLTASNHYQRVYLIIIPLITPLIIFSPTPWISILPSISTHEIPFISMNINTPIQYHHESHETNLYLLTHPLIYVLGVN